MIRSLGKELGRLARSGRWTIWLPANSSIPTSATGRSSSWPIRSRKPGSPHEPDTAASLGDLLGRLTREDDLEIAWFLPEDHVPGRPEARSARLVSWDGATATVEHDGPCDLVIARSFDPGWTARINGRAVRRVLRVDGGYQGVRLSGSGTERVELRYSPPGWRWWLWISSLSAAAAITVAGAFAGHADLARKSRARPQLRHGLSFSSSLPMVSISGPDDLLAEVEADAGGRKQLGKRPRAAQCQGLLVVGHRSRCGRTATVARSARRPIARCRTRCNKTDTRKCEAGDATNGRGLLRNPTSRRCRRTARASLSRRPCDRRECGRDGGRSSAGRRRQSRSRAG